MNRNPSCWPRGCFPLSLLGEDGKQLSSFPQTPLSFLPGPSHSVREVETQQVIPEASWPLPDLSLRLEKGAPFTPPAMMSLTC